jgi:murein DD-endopeptidase MepM/ murein hydrolase activator NlpD
MAGQNSVRPSDEQGPITTSSSSGFGFEKSLNKGIEKAVKDIEKIAKSLLGAEKSSEKIGKNLSGKTGSKDMGLGMGESPVYGYNSVWRSMSGGQKIGLGALAVGATAMSMAPNTMNAVTQRIAADTTAGVSGMTANALIGTSNRLVGNGATSAMGPTMSAMALAYQGGYTANSLSSKNIMGQLAGVSAITGMPNERAAAAVAGANGMNFLRAGIQLRDAKGNQKAPSAMINDVYNFLYRGRKISSQEAMLAFRPGSRSYYSIQQMAGGDQNLMQVLQAGVLARANSGAPLTAATLSNAQKSLDTLGVGKDSPVRAMFKYNTSEAKVLQSTQKGLVGGYNAGLDTAAGLNNAFASVAEAAGGVTTALMGLKGFLQTFPSAGNVAGTVSGLTSGVAGMGMNVLQMRMAGKMLGMGGGGTTAAAIKGGSKAAKAAAAAATAAKAARLAKYMKFAKFAGPLAALASGYEGYTAEKAHGGFDWGALLSATGQGAATGGLFGAVAGEGIGAVPGAIVGGLLAGGGNLLGQLFASSQGRGGEAGGSSQGPAGAQAPASGHLMSPVPSGARITSHFGPRKVTYNSKGLPSSSFHHGTDYGIVENTPLRAVDGGTVLRQGYDPKGYGTYLVVQHKNNKQSLYAHLNRVITGAGKKVNAGDLIALSGGRDGAPGAGNSNGPHLHFEYGTSVSPGKGQVDSEKLFTKQGWLSSLFNNIKGFLGMGPSPRGNTYGTDVNINMSKDSMLGKNSSLSSPSLTSLIAGLTKNGSPVGYDDLAKHMSKSQIAALQNQNIDYSLLQGSGGKIHNKELMQLLYRKGFKGRALDTAFGVAMAESGGRPGALGDVHLQTAKWGPSVGLFQIRSLKHWQDYNDKYRDAHRLPDSGFNSEAAMVKSSGGTNWKAWTTFTHGSFAKFLADSAVTRKALKIPSYDVGTERVPNDQLAMVHKDEMVINARTADRIRNGGSGSMGGSTINVNMTVNIAQASPQEAERMVGIFADSLKKKIKLEQIGIS